MLVFTDLVNLVDFSKFFNYKMHYTNKLKHNIQLRKLKNK